MIFSISTLNLFMNVLLHISFKDSGSGWLIEASGLQDMCCIDPVIVSPAHNMFLQIRTELKLVYRYLD